MNTKRESGDLVDQSIKNSGAVPAAVSPLIVSVNTFATVLPSNREMGRLSETGQARRPATIQIIYQEDFRE